MIGPSRAREVLTSVGWLAKQPASFQAQVFKHAIRVRYAAGKVIYHAGDPPGGVFGVVSGAIIVHIATPERAPHPAHVATPGLWTGDAPFFMGGPRWLTLQAALGSELVYLPLEAMEYMASRDPTAVRRFAQIIFYNVRLLFQVIADLQCPDDRKRVALALRRVAAAEGQATPLSQAALGLISNTSRKTVNAALNDFATAGWVDVGYRAITVTDIHALRRYGESTED